MKAVCEKMKRELNFRVTVAEAIQLNLRPALNLLLNNDLNQGRT